MKKLAMVASVAVAAAGLSFNAGCETPGYSTEERFTRIGRNWGYEYEQIQQDVDYIFELDPATHLTHWNIQ
jgi:hypothetical protein